MTANYIYETNAIQPDALAAIFARVTSGEPFTTADLSAVYREAHPLVELQGIATNGSYEQQMTPVGPSHGDLARIIRALRETNSIMQVAGPKGRVTWGLNPVTGVNEPLPVRLNRANAILRKGTSPIIPSLGKSQTARELAAKQYDTIGPPDVNLDGHYPSCRPSYYRGFNEKAVPIASTLEALPPFKRVIETLKVIVGETVAKVVFDLRGVQDRDLEDIREASPDDKLRWANRHTPGIVIPTPNQQWSHRPNVPSIVLPIPV